MTPQMIAPLAVLLLAGAAAENLVSGPQVGDKAPGEFRTLFLNGPKAGEEGCPASDGAYALLFANDVSDGLTALLKRLDGPPEGPRVFVVFGAVGDAGLKKRLKALVEKEQFRGVVTCLGASAGVEKWEVAEESELTAVLVRGGSVKANFAFRKDEFTASWADAIVAALGDLSPKKHEGD